MTELAHEYQEGRWTAVAGHGFLALVEPEAPWRLVEGLWQVARGGGDVLGALGVLAADGFAALPRFAVVETASDGSVHAVLRGPVRLQLQGADDVQEVAAGEGAVWTEHRALGVHGLRVVVDDAPDATWWPLVGGVVRAGGLRTGASVGAPVATVRQEPATHEQEVVPPAVADLSDEPGGVPVADVATPAAAPVDVLAEPVVVDEPVPGPSPADLPTDEPSAVVVPDEPALVGDEPPAAEEPGVVAEEPAVAEESPVATRAAATDWWTSTPAPVEEPPVPAAATATVPEADDDPWGLRAPEPSPTDLPDAATPPRPHLVPVPESEPAPEPDIPWWPLTPPAAAQAPEPVPAPAAPQPDPEPDDHDGMTILSSDLARLRDRLPAWSQDAVPGPFPAPAPAPLPARLVLSTGLVVALDRAVLLGRAPQVARVTNRELPRLVTVPSPNQDISRTHAEVRVEGEHVVVTDLDSTNGVHVSRPGEGVRRLHPGEPSVVGTDEVVDLGDGVTFTVERSAL